MLDIVFYMTGGLPAGRPQPDLLLTFIKRCRNYFCRKVFSSDIDFNFLTLICKLHGQECEPDIFLKKRSRAARRDIPDALVVDKDIVAIAGDPGLRHFESDDLSCQAALLLLLQRIAADEVVFI